MSCCCKSLCASFTLWLQVCAIKAPGFGESRRANLEDLAILTGGEVRSYSLNYKLYAVTRRKKGTYFPRKCATFPTIRTVLLGALCRWSLEIVATVLIKSNSICLVLPKRLVISLNCVLDHRSSLIFTFACYRLLFLWTIPLFCMAMETKSLLKKGVSR